MGMRLLVAMVFLLASLDCDHPRFEAFLCLSQIMEQSGQFSMILALKVRSEFFRPARHADEVFDEHFAFVPEDVPRRPTATQVKAFERDGKWSGAAKEGAEWWEAFDARAQGRHLLAVEVLTSDLIEISMVWQDDLTGIWLKSRPDCLPANGFDFGDLKTFSPRGADLVLSAQRAITDHGYAIQMALAIMGAEQVLGVSAQRSALVFVQTTEPYETIVIEIDDESIYWAKVLIREALDRMKHGLATGEWPGVARDLVTYQYPPSMLHRFGEMQLNGELPNLERI